MEAAVGLADMLWGLNAGGYGMGVFCKEYISTSENVLVCVLTPFLLCAHMCLGVGG